MALAVGLTPQLLPAIISINLAHGAKRMAHGKVIVKRLASIENFAGEYAVELPGESATGHFGLAVRDYTHSTALNRRYPDLITQRLLKAAMAGLPPPYGNDELDAVAKHCIEEEDRAKKVERQVGKSAAAMLLESRIGERFDAIVTGASDRGGEFFAQLLCAPNRRQTCPRHIISNATSQAASFQRPW